jgi:hypothetical protein
MGKNIIVTDNHMWSTEAIVTASLDRSRIENQFRASKASCHVRVNPMFHWPNLSPFGDPLSVALPLGGPALDWRTRCFGVPPVEAFIEMPRV